MSTTVTETINATSSVANGTINCPVNGSNNAFSKDGSHQSRLQSPLKLTGALESYKRKEITPLMGTEFVDAHIVDIIHAPNADELIRDLAILISQRGFCVFRGQSDLTVADQKHLAHRLGQLTTRPATSGLYIHPVNQAKLPDGSIDPELMTPSRNPQKKLYTREGGYSKATQRNQSRADGWHTDGGYENAPVDYTLLHMVKVPEEGSGGDTMFASAYEAYDLLSEPMKGFFEQLNATFMPLGHEPEKIVDRIWKGTRGAPENQGAHLTATHPAIRTNPVTGMKSLSAFGHHLERFEGLGDVENAMLKEFLLKICCQNHQLQARHHWSQDDLVLWDNRSVFHSATYDYGTFTDGKRIGNRVCGVGEVPYLDPSSVGRREALGIA